MDYYHVLIEQNGASKGERCIFADLSEEELKAKFLKYYRAGRNLFVNAEIVDIRSIKSVRIIRTEQNSEAELKKIQTKSQREIDEINKHPSQFLFISPGRGHDLEDIVEAGEDATSQFIQSAPGQGGVIKSILDHPWISGISISLIASLITAVLAKLFGLV